MSDASRGRYIGLDRGAGAIARHNRAVPADAQGDACACSACTDTPSPHAARVADPAAALFACPADAQRPMAAVHLSTPGVVDSAAERQFMRRGPVQDESKLADPFDRYAARKIEGRDFMTDLDA